MPLGKKIKTWSRSSIVTNSVKTLKIVHIKTRFIFSQPWKQDVQDKGCGQGFSEAYLLGL